MLGERVVDIPRNNQDGETRRNLETHLSATVNRQTPQTPPLQVDANADSKLTGAYRSI